MKKTKAEKGITLVALIITIIVLLILAVVAINAVRNDGIIDYAKNARTEYEKAQGEEQNTLNYYLSQIESTNGIHNGTILKGGSYTRGEESFGEGDKFPETPVKGDTYIYGDYEYTYYNDYTEINASWPETADENMNGWRVKLLNTVPKNQPTYEEILTTINGANIKSLSATFKDCTSLSEAPIIPSTVVDMRGTFIGCSALVTAPSIPNNVISLEQAFKDCTALENVPKMPDTIITMRNAFYNCENLISIPNFPNDVSDLSWAFRGCINLKKVPAIPANVTNMDHTFYMSGIKDDVEIRTLTLEKYDLCFEYTKENIFLVGVDNDNDGKFDNFDLLEELAKTANEQDDGVKGNVTVK